MYPYITCDPVGTMVGRVVPHLRDQMNANDADVERYRFIVTSLQNCRTK